MKGQGNFFLRGKQKSPITTHPRLMQRMQSLSHVTCTVHFHYVTNKSDRNNIAGVTI